ncbi:MAG: hypothetical protein OXC05_12255 [Halieaceae bacterium]|nr:hypothetical protein [Halieaceae bacterium]
MFGLREDAESAFAHIKRRTNGRARSVGADRIELDLFAHQQIVAIQAIIHHHLREQADISEWFGQYSPNRKPVQLQVVRQAA